MAVTLTTALVTAADPNHVTLTFNKPLCVIDNVVVTLGGVAQPLKAPEKLFGSTTRIALLTPVINGNVIAISATCYNSDYGVGDQLQLAAQAVTNQVV